MTKAKKTYIELRNDLEQVLRELQNVEGDIDRSLELYKQGEKLIDQLQIYLEGAKNSVKVIKDKK